MEWVDLSGRGTVHSFCVMHADLVRGFEVPYVVLQVRLDEQEDLLMLGNLDAQWVGKVAIGEAVRATFEDRGGEVILPQFEVIAARHDG